MKIYAELPKGRGYVLRISSEQFGGRHVIDTRIWFATRPGDRDTLRLTPERLSVSVERLPELIAALQAAEMDLSERGLLQHAAQHQSRRA